MTLYLCKLNPDKPDPKTGDPSFVGVVGRIVQQGDGYRFLSNMSAHGNSRKAWPSANACIPKWTDKYGFLRLFDKVPVNA